MNHNDLNEINIVFCGSVDNGKSTITGHLLKLLGHVDEREFDKITLDAKKNGMEKWKYAYILDVLDEERLRGKTHDYTIVPIDIIPEAIPNCPDWLNQPSYQNRRINFIDTPGHKNFVMRMVEGACEADVAVLIVSLKKGEFEAGIAGQTLEHLYLLRGMGIKQLVIAFNKMDLIEWDRSILEIKKNELLGMIKKLKFPTIKIVPTSAWDGLNLIDDYKPSDHDANFGPCLLKTLLDCKKSTAKTDLVTVTNNKIQCQMIFIEGNYSLITVGYRCILHNGKNQYMCEISKIRDKKFVKKGESATVMIKIETDNNYKIPEMGKNVILRENDSSVAIGVIIPIDKSDK